MSNKSIATIATMGIDIGKNSFHVVILYAFDLIEAQRDGGGLMSGIEDFEAQVSYCRETCSSHQM